MIISTKKSVIERQKQYGVYRAEQFIDSPYISAYWSGHLIEELCEFIAYNSDKAMEAADCIIFLQNLTAYLYPFETLIITLDEHTPYCWELHEVIKKLRDNIPDRKTWKDYPKPEFATFYQEVIVVVIEYLLWYKKAELIEEAYFIKEAKNYGRKDWNLEFTK